MCQAIERLHNLRVADVMNRSVCEVSASQGMDAAAVYLMQHKVSTAPVVDELGKCVGMLSAVDFVRRACSGDNRNAEPHVLQQPDPDSPLEIAAPGDYVGAYMTEAVQSTTPDQSLLTAARMMCVEHLHRLPVFEGTQLVGMVSTMDVVAALMNAVDEMAS